MIAHMNKILLIAVILSLSACASSQEEPSKTVEKEKVAQQHRQLPKKVSKPTIRQASKRNINIAIDTSRPADEIKKEYPTTSS